MRAPAPEKIPAGMRAMKRWVLWRLEDVGREKPAKVPYAASGRRARTTDEQDWSSWDDAAAALAQWGERFAGLGFVFTQTPFVGVDLDHAIDDGGRLSADAAAIAAALPGAYAERSQSGRGLHVIVRGQLPPGGRRRGAVEMYDASSPRYFAITGDATLAPPSDPLPDRTPELAALHARHIGEAQTVAPVGLAPQGDVPEGVVADLVGACRVGKEARRFFALFDAGEYREGKRSESDYDLAKILWRNAGALGAAAEDAVVAAMAASALYRDKWKEKRGAVSLLRHTVRTARPGGGEGLAAAAPTFRLLDAAELGAEPEPAWLIPGTLPQGALAVLYGKSVGGKSFLALDWALRLAAAGAGVVYVAAEGWAGTKRRVRAWQVANGDPAAPPPPCVFMSGNVNLLDEANVAAFLAQARAKLGERGDPRLFVLDTLNQNMPGGDENAAGDMTAVVGSANMLRRETGATVLLIHHPRKADEVERGHSSLANAADTMMRLTVDDTTGQRVLECTKQKDAAPFEPARHALREVVDPDTGRPASLVMEPASGRVVPSAVPGSGRIRDVYRLFLEAPGQVVSEREVTAELVRLGLARESAETQGKRQLRALVADYGALAKVTGGWRLATDGERSLAAAAAARTDAALDAAEARLLGPAGA